MKLNFFGIPARDSMDAEAELNGFLTANRVIHMERAFVPSESAPSWSICVQWLPQGSNVTAAIPKSEAGKVDYREVLDDATFQIFAVLRTWRKTKQASRE